MKTLNDFKELLADLDAEIKREKKEDYKDFLHRVRENVSLWSIRYDRFLTDIGRKKEEKQK